MNTIALASVPLIPEGTEPASQRNRMRSYFDFIVDGSSVNQQLPGSDIGVLTRDWDARQFARRLLLEEEGDPEFEGRIQIYGCRLCLDPLCGSYAVRIEHHGDRIRWSKIDRCAPTLTGDVLHLDFEETDVGPFEFDAVAYRALLAPFAASAD